MGEGISRRGADLSSTRIEFAQIGVALPVGDSIDRSPPAGVSRLCKLPADVHLRRSGATATCTLQAGTLTGANVGTFDLHVGGRRLLGASSLSRKRDRLGREEDTLAISSRISCAMYI